MQKCYHNWIIFVNVRAGKCKNAITQAVADAPLAVHEILNPTLKKFASFVPDRPLFLGPTVAILVYKDVFLLTRKCNKKYVFYYFDTSFRWLSVYAGFRQLRIASYWHGAIVIVFSTFLINKKPLIQYTFREIKKSVITNQKLIFPN